MSTPLAELRALNVKKQRESQGDTPEEIEKSDSQSYDNMTGHMDSKPGRKTGIPSEVLPTGQTVSKPARKQAAKPSVLPSVLQSIKATVQQASDGVPTLKTVTIKLAPELDRRVEEHCFATGRKKQDVVRDSLLLYFEAVESIERGEA
jgi:hypothetical protein